MASIFSWINELFWNEYFWISNFHWKDFESTETEKYPSVYELWIPLFFALIISIIRYIWETKVAYPIGKYYKIKETLHKSPEYNESLESSYNKLRRFPDKKELGTLSKQLNWDTRKIEIWWRRKKAQGKPSNMNKFKETSWRCLFYLLSFWSGLIILWSKPWFWDTKHCWYSYPKQVISDDVWWYYMIELGFYWSLVFSLFRDNKRKDFRETIIHHIVTIILMMMSWTANMIRIGSLVLCVHDAVDYIMEGAKAAKYCRKDKLCNVLFVIFTIVWFFTRILILPLVIIRSTLFEAITILNTICPIYYIYNLLLCILQALHLFWFYIILHMMYTYIFHGEIKKDKRSDTEHESEDDQLPKESSNGHASNLNNNNTHSFKNVNRNALNKNMK